MKTLVVIWVAALLSGVGTVGYINSEVNSLVVKQTPDCVLQCPNVELQPARNTVQVTSTAPLQNAPSDEFELQPALGYKALNWNVSSLTVAKPTAIDHLEVR